MKNKKIIVITIISLIILVAGTLAVLHFTTDLLKTNQQLFYKYALKTKIVNSTFIQKYKDTTQKILKNSNSSKATIDINTSSANAQTDIADVKKVLTIKTNGLENAELNQSYRDLTFLSDEKNIASFKYIKDGNSYGAKIDNVLVKYIVLENSNLKEFCSKLGIEDISTIPDTIPNNYSELLNIDENTLNTLKTEYSKLIYNNISKDNFYKTKNEDKTATISVSLTQQETVNLLKSILETAKNDNTLLNLILSKSQLLEYKEVTAETIQNEIQSYIDKLSNETYSTEKDFIKLSLVIKEKNVIKLNFEVNYMQKDNNVMENSLETANTTNIYNVEIDFSESGKIKETLKENNIEKTNSIITYSYDDTNLNLNIETESKQNEEKTYKVKLQTQMTNYQTNNITQNCSMEISTGDIQEYQIKCLNEINLKQDIQIEKLTTENSLKLNDLSKEQIGQLLTAIILRAQSLYGEETTNTIINSASSL